MAFFGQSDPNQFHNPVVELYSHRNEQMDFSRIYGQLGPPRPATFQSHVPGMYTFQQLSVMGYWPQTPPYRFPVPIQSVPSVPPFGNGEEYHRPGPGEPELYERPSVQPFGNGEEYHRPGPGEPEPYERPSVPPFGNGEEYHRPPPGELEPYVRPSVPTYGCGEEYHWPAGEPGPYERVFYGDPRNPYHRDHFIQNVRQTGESAFIPRPILMIPSQRESKDANRQKRTVLTCKFCKSNGETHEFYSSHSTVVDEIVRCPVLRKHVCGYCGATGDKAHTRKYCPKRIQDETEARASSGGDTDGGGDRPSFRYETGRTAAGGYSLAKF